MFKKFFRHFSCCFFPCIFQVFFLLYFCFFVFLFLFGGRGWRNISPYPPVNSRLYLEGSDYMNSIPYTHRSFYFHRTRRGSDHFYLVCTGNCSCVSLVVQTAAHSRLHQKPFTTEIMRENELSPLTQQRFSSLLVAHGQRVLVKFLG